MTGNVPALRQLRALSGEARIGLTWTDGEEPPLALLEELDAEYWNPWFGVLSEAGAAAVHAAGRLVSTWTVDEAADMAAGAAWGADAVVSNQVGALVQFVANRARPERQAEASSTRAMMAAATWSARVSLCSHSATFDFWMAQIRMEPSFAVCTWRPMGPGLTPLMEP